MNALQLVDTDDDVAQGGAVLENEDSRVAAGVSIGVTSATTIELLVAHVLASRDDTGSREGDDGTAAGGDVESLSRGEAGQHGGDKNLGLHFGCDLRDKAEWKILRGSYVIVLSERGEEGRRMGE